ncbi:MAG: hypothetical protein F6K17_23460 [Okeania sp. SIO3C4]|nr:hypothetical protein [Okeania sp. SIO3C4]
MKKAEGRRQKAEGRRQKAEGRRQKAEGRRQKAEGRRENCLWIVNDLPLRVLSCQTILSTPVDGATKKINIISFHTSDRLHLLILE